MSREYDRTVKLGNVQVANVFRYKDITPPTDIGQDIIEKTMNEIMCGQNMCDVKDNGNEIRFGSYVYMDNDFDSCKNRGHRYEHAYVRVAPAHSPFIPTNIVYSANPFEYLTYTNSHLQKYFKSGIGNAKKLAILFDPTEVNQECARYLSGYIEETLPQCDFTAPFTCLYVLMDLLSCPAADQAIWQNPVNETPIFNMKTVGETVQPEMLRFLKSVNENHIFLPLNLVGSLMGAINTLCRYNEAYVVPSDQQSLVHLSFNFPRFNFSFFTNDPGASLPEAIAPTTNSFRDLLFKICYFYGLRAHCPPAFFMASCLLNGHHGLEPIPINPNDLREYEVLEIEFQAALTADPRPDPMPVRPVAPTQHYHHRWFTAALETHTVSMTPFIPYNILWRLTSSPLVRGAIDVLLSNEGLLLHNYNYNQVQLRQCGALLAAKFSFSISTALNYHNLTGNLINDYLNGSFRPPIDQLFYCKRNKAQTGIASLALGLWQHIGKGRFSSYMRRETNHFLPCGRPKLAENTGFASAWGNHVPYIMIPLVISCITTKFVDVHGFYSCDSYVNRNNYCVNFHLLSPMFRDEDDYGRRDPKEAHLFMPSYQLLLNMVLQYHEINAPNLKWYSTPDPFGRNVSLHEVELPHFQPEIDPYLHCFVPGM